MSIYDFAGYLMVIEIKLYHLTAPELNMYSDVRHLYCSISDTYDFNPKPSYGPLLELKILFF